MKILEKKTTIEKFKDLRQPGDCLWIERFNGSNFFEDTCSHDNFLDSLEEDFSEQKLKGNFLQFENGDHWAVASWAPSPVCGKILAWFHSEGGNDFEKEIAEELGAKSYGLSHDQVKKLTEIEDRSFDEDFYEGIGLTTFWFDFMGDGDYCVVVTDIDKFSSYIATDSMFLTWEI